MAIMTVITKISASIILFLFISVSCSKVEDSASNDAISAYDDLLSINFSSLSSKAMSNDVDTMKKDPNGFIVYGVEVNSSEWYNYLDGNSYIYDTIALKWNWRDDSQIAYWPSPFNQMNFYAFYPATASGFTLTATAPSSIIGDFTVESSILDQTDYLACVSGDVLTRPQTGVLALYFTHIMSKISFSVLQEAGVLTIIRQLGIENIINQGSYDYVNAEWQDLSNNNIASFDDYVGSSGPFAKYGVEDQVDPIRIDDHYLMLIPQTGGSAEGQTPLWDGSYTLDSDGEAEISGAYVSIRYRTSKDTDSTDLIGYAFRQTSDNDTQWAENEYFYSAYKKDGGTYNGPLYVKAGFKLSPELLNWEAGTGYNYTLPLATSGGVYLSEYYYDVSGVNTKIRVDNSPKVGDPIYTTDITLGVSVTKWIDNEYELNFK